VNEYNFYALLVCERGSLFFEAFFFVFSVSGQQNIQFWEVEIYRGHIKSYVDIFHMRDYVALTHIFRYQGYSNLFFIRHSRKKIYTHFSSSFFSSLLVNSFSMTFADITLLTFV
jgi:hypothetical protein